MARKNEFYDDDIVHPFGENKPLVDTIKKWQQEGKVSVSMHGIHHRNWDRNAPDLNNNYSTGAEMWTERDMTEPLKQGKKHLEELFGKEIYCFAAPQNLLSIQSYHALKNAGLNFNGPLIANHNYKQAIKIYGVWNYAKILYKRFFDLQHYYFERPISHNGFKTLTNFGGLYPNGRSFETFKKDIDYIRKVNGVFVLNTHSYAHEFYLPQFETTMQNAIIQILDYLKQFDDIEYTTLEEVLR